MDQELKAALEAAKKSNLEYKAAQTAADEERKKLGHVTAELQAKVDLLNEATIGNVEAAQKRYDELERKINRGGVAGLENGHPAKLAAELKAFNSRLMKATGGRRKAFSADEYVSFYKPAFSAWVRGAEPAVESMDAGFKAALSVGSDPSGGYLVPVDMTNDIVRFIYESSPIRQRATVRTTNRDRFQIRRSLDRVTLGGWTAETSARAATATPQLLVPYEVPVSEGWAFPLITQQEIDDADENVEAMLSEEIGKAFSLDENLAFVSGTGPAKPRGFLTYPSAVPAKGAFEKVEQVKTGVNGGFAASPNGPDIFVDLMGKMKEPLLAGASWAMTRTTLAAARKLKDSQGRYQVELEPGLNGRPGFSILGFEVDRWSDMPEIASASLSIAFANWKEAYVIGDHATGLKMLRDPYTQKPNVGLYCTKRVGGDVRNFEAIKLGLFSA